MSIPARDHSTTYWSPYQKLSVRPIYEAGGRYNRTKCPQTIPGINGSSIFRRTFLQRHPDLLNGHPIEWDPYNLPYRFFLRRRNPCWCWARATGNDVAAALRNGAQRVTAVEIDPLILQLGRRLHFEKPYDSPKVTVVVDDARSYIQNSHEQFDLIVFSLLDSHTTSSNFFQHSN